MKEGTRAFPPPTQSEGRRPMDAGESRRAERKQRRDRERRRKGAEQSDQAFGGDDVAVRVRETSSTSPRRGRNEIHIVFSRETGRFADPPRPAPLSAKVAEAFAAARHDDVPELVRPDPAPAPPAPPPRARRGFFSAIDYDW